MLKEIHERSIHELQEILSPDLQEELAAVTLPFSSESPTDAELRIAQAQLVGWLEGLFHGIQATLFTQQMQAQRQFEEMRSRRSLDVPGGPPASACPARISDPMTAPVSLGAFDWQPASWRKRAAAAHQPAWPDADELERVIGELRRMPPLVFAGEARSLRESLAEVSRGDGFLLHAGDCAESFAEFTADNIRDKLKVILQMSVVLTYSTGVPTREGRPHRRAVRQARVPRRSRRATARSCPRTSATS